MEFAIKRLKTSLGTFRLRGELIAYNSDEKINYEEAEFMGTDGWVEINTESEGGMAILEQIKTEVIINL
ncbi:hypothetical protein BA953_02350 [Vibrio coralliilyticus]|uniref:hypothetical protein n=1 Tax=Vibrio coralliilyticus TaxID=190893 RepID=UPI000810969C|nr:hypothetical protein [Vibrio coralliilyticus]ANW23132.1 hypothetical protein BA953_02350 [Vibrio coralliilyticus]